MRRVTLEDGTVVRAGTVAEAAAECVTAKSPHGIKPKTYRLYERLDRSPVRGWPAPGPFKVRDPETGDLIVARDPVTGATLRNLDEVAAWNRARVPGRRPDRDTPDTLRRTQWRQLLLQAAADGRLGVVAPGELGLPGQEDTPARRTARIGQAIVELAQIGLIARADESEPWALTTAGHSVLDRFRREEDEHSQ